MTLVYTSLVQSDIDRTTLLVQNMPTGVQECYANVKEASGTKQAPGSFPAYSFAQDPAKATQAITASDNLVEAICLWLRGEHGTNIEPVDTQLGDDVRKRIQQLRVQSNVDPDTIFDLSPGTLMVDQSTRANSLDPTPSPAEAPQERKWRGMTFPAMSQSPAPGPDRGARGFTPSPASLNIEGHHLTALSSMAKDLKVQESDKVDPERTPVSSYRKALERIFINVPGTVDIVYGRVSTYAEKDAAIRAILMRTFTPSLIQDWDAENCQTRLPTAHHVFEWVVGKCSVSSRNRRHHLLKLVLSGRWDGRPETARDFLRGWKANIVALNDALETPWTPQAQLDLLRSAMTGESAYFVAPFLTLDRDVRAGRVLDANALESFFSDLMAIATDAAGQLDRVDDAPTALQSNANLRRLRCCFACGQWGHVVRECQDQTAVQRFNTTRERATPAALPKATAKMAVYVSEAPDSEGDSGDGYESVGSGSDY